MHISVAYEALFPGGPDQVKGDRRLGADQAGDGLGSLFHLLVGLLPTLGGSLADAVVHMVIQKRQSHRLQSAGGGRNLGKDVDAVGIGLDHLLNGPDLTFDTPKSGDGSLLVAGISGQDPLHSWSDHGLLGGNREGYLGFSAVPTGHVHGIRLEIHH